MPCSCSSSNLAESLRTVSIPLSSSYASLISRFPSAGLSALSQTAVDASLYLHRVVGQADGLSFDQLELVSCAVGEASATTASRRFVGSMGATEFDYTMTANLPAAARDAPTSILSFTLDIASPAIPNTPRVSIAIDLQRRWVISATPDPTTLDEDIFVPTPAVNHMILLAAGGPALLAKKVNKLCLIAILGGAAFVCLPCLAVPGPVGVAAFILCVGPAAAGALIACDP